MTIVLLHQLNRVSSGSPFRHESSHVGEKKSARRKDQNPNLDMCSFTVWLKRLTCCRVELQLLLEQKITQKLKQEQFERFEPDASCK